MLKHSNVMSKLCKHVVCNMRANHDPKAAINKNHAKQNACQKPENEAAQFETGTRRVDDVVMRDGEKQASHQQP